MTNHQQIMLPLMAATVGRVYTSYRFSPHGIDTLRFPQPGITFPYGDDVGSSQEPDSTRQTPQQSAAGSADK